MFCKNCGGQLNENAVFCTTCGVSVGQGVGHCANCGGHVNPGAAICLNCGAALTNMVSPNGMPVNGSGAPKSKIAAGLLGIFLGGFGVHNFMLGYTGKAVAQLLMSVLSILITFFTCGVLGFTMIAAVAAEIWGLVEGIMILCGSIRTDAKGIPLE